ncbi:MAG: hypothetical protein QXW65_01030 [Candidatus Pacearchaeota archaeon]
MKRKRGKKQKSKSKKTEKSAVTFEDRIKKPAAEVNKEKVILLLFLVFVILTLIIMFRSQLPEQKLLGAAITKIELQKTQLNASEKLQGNVVLTLQPEDILPKNSVMKFLILTNASKISKQYICPNGRTILWKNETDIIEPDPEGKCCLVSGQNCAQIVLNSGFDADLDTASGRWQKIARNASPEQISIIDFPIDEENISRVAALDSSPSGEQARAFVALKQVFTGARSIKISDLTQWIVPVPPESPEGPGVTGAAIVVPPPQLHYTLTVIVTGEGTITSQPEGINCIGVSGVNVTCKATYVANTNVILTASPASNFVSWSGACSGNATTCTVTMNSEKTVSAFFKLREGIDSLFYDVSYESDNPCAFEIVVRGVSKENAPRALHYFYNLSSACPITDFCRNNASEKCISRALEQPEIGLVSLKENLYKDWIGFFGSTEDNLTSIELVSYSKVSNNEIYSQVVYFDNVKIKKPAIIPERCEEANTRESPKKCCVAGTGYGNYYGEQLACDPGYECWSKCTNSVNMTLQEFISKSAQSQKYNKTEGLCQAIVDGAIIELYDWCGEGDAGKGYTACLDTSNTSRLVSCRNWNNAYEVNLSKLNLAAPNENGTYQLLWLFTYTPRSTLCDEDGDGEYDDPCTIFSKTVSFTVGTPLGGGAGSQENWACDAWSACINGLQYANCTETNTGRQELKNRTCCWSCTEWEPSECPENLTQTRTCVESTTMECLIQNATKPDEVQSCTRTRPCSQDDWQCSAWSKCEEGRRYRTCNKINNCDENDPSSYIPVQEESCRKTIFGGLMIYIIIIIIAAAVAVLLFLKFFRKPSTGLPGKTLEIKKAKPEARYPEVVSYIKEALAAGASKKEIEAKLLEAGWPKDIIDESFAAAGA